MEKSAQIKKRQKIITRFNRHNLFIGFILLALLITITINGMYSFHKAGLPAGAFFDALRLDITATLKGAYTANSLAHLKPFIRPTPSIYPPASSYLEPTFRPDQLTTFTSNKLGISFTYKKPVINVQPFYVKEIGNTVYIYYHEFQGTDQEFLKSKEIGKYVEVFYKSVGTSFTDAIAEHVFGGPVPAYCELTKNTNYGSPRMDETYERVVLRTILPPTPNLSSAEARLYFEKCTKYNIQMGHSYFMIDPQHPDRVLFVEVEQDNILSGVKGYTWDETIKIF